MLRDFTAAGLLILAKASAMKPQPKTKAVAPVGSLNLNFRRLETANGDRFFNPKKHIVNSTAFIVAKLVIETDDCCLASLQQRAGFLGPIDAQPSVGRVALIVQENF